METWTKNIENLIKQGNIQIATVLTAMNIERNLSMLIELYYKPRNSKPIVNNLNFHNMIGIVKKLSLLKRTHWYKHFNDIKEARNKIVHDLDYWEKLDGNNNEKRKVEKICRENLKYLTIPISDLDKELIPKVTKEAKIVIGRYVYTEPKMFFRPGRYKYKFKK